MTSVQHNSATRIASLWRGYHVRKTMDYVDEKISDWPGYDAMLRVYNEEVARRPSLQAHLDAWLAALRRAEERLSATCDCCDCRGICDYDYDNRYTEDSYNDWWHNDGGGYDDW